MARIPAAPEPVDPLGWILAGRWQGCGRFSLHDHECNRALWFSVRWATPAAPALKQPAHLDLGPALDPAMPPTLSGPAFDAVCPGCPHETTCWGLAELAKGCRTCRHVEARGRWFCTLHGDEVETDLQRVGCDAWESIA